MIILHFFFLIISRDTTCVSSIIKKFIFITSLNPKHLHVRKEVHTIKIHCLYRTKKNHFHQFQIKKWKLFLKLLK